MVLHKYIFMPIWSVINHCQYGQLTDKFDWQACSNADWLISPSHLTWPRCWPSIKSALVHMRQLRHDHAASKRERVKPFQAYRLGSYPMNNITSVICCFITRFGKKHNIRVVVIDCTIQKMQRHRVCCVQTLIVSGWLTVSYDLTLRMLFHEILTPLLSKRWRH